MDTLSKTQTITSTTIITDYRIIPTALLCGIYSGGDSTRDSDNATITTKVLHLRQASAGVLAFSSSTAHSFLVQRKEEMYCL